MSSNKNCGNILSQDIATAYAYACDQINRLKCNDVEVQNQVCAIQGQNCLQWKQNDNMRIWNTPSLVTSKKCTPSTVIGDCKDQSGASECVPVKNSKGETEHFCGYKPTLGFGPNADPVSGIQSGKCHVIDQETCSKYSKSPFTCTESGCKFIKNATGAYTEWSPYAGMCDDGRTCSTDSDCPQGNFCRLNSSQELVCRLQGGSSCLPGSTCINGVCSCDSTTTSPNPDDLCPGTSTCNNGLCTTTLDDPTNPTGQCVLGNFINKEWCENPQSRCAPDSSGNYPKECHGSTSSPGITDVPPFFYNDKIGQCFMTKDYCSFFDMEYTGTTCTPQADSDGKPTKSDCTNTQWDICVPNSDGSGNCVGPGVECNLNTGDDIAQFIVGKTLFALFSGRHCDLYKHPHELKLNTKSTPKGKGVDKHKGLNTQEKLMDIFKQLNNLPQTLESLADPKMIASKKLLQKDFVPGIDLYLITWKPEAGIKPNNIRVGFDINQVKAKYPNMISKNKGLLHIKINKKDIGIDKGIKRMYLTLGTLDSMSINIANNFMKNSFLGKNP